MHLSFGFMQDFDEVGERFPDAGVMHPLDGYEKNKPEEEPIMHCGFYIKAVPAIFEGDLTTQFLEFLFKRNLLRRNEVFQLTAASETNYAPEDNESLIIFNYEVSPFAV